MVTIRAYIKGNDLETNDDTSVYLPISNGRKVSVYFDDGDAYVNFNTHAGSVNIPAEVRAQITRVTIRENITDPQIGDEIKRGEYVVPGDQENEAHATVIGERTLDSFSVDGYYNVLEVQIEIAANTPESAMSLFQDILAGTIKPVRSYGKSTTNAPVETD